MKLIIALVFAALIACGVLFYRHQHPNIGSCVTYYDKSGSKVLYQDGAHCK